MVVCASRTPFTVEARGKRVLRAAPFILQTAVNLELDVLAQQETRSPSVIARANNLQLGD
jgi:hypothetical protein